MIPARSPTPKVGMADAMRAALSSQNIVDPGGLTTMSPTNATHLSGQQQPAQVAGMSPTPTFSSIPHWTPPGTYAEFRHNNCMTPSPPQAPTPTQNSGTAQEYLQRSRMHLTQGHMPRLNNGSVNGSAPSSPQNRPGQMQSPLVTNSYINTYIASVANVDLEELQQQHAGNMLPGAHQNRPIQNVHPTHLQQQQHANNMLPGAHQNRPIFMHPTRQESHQQQQQQHANNMLPGAHQNRPIQNLHPMHQESHQQQQHANNMLPGAHQNRLAQNAHPMHQESQPQQHANSMLPRVHQNRPILNGHPMHQENPQQQHARPNTPFNPPHYQSSFGSEAPVANMFAGTFGHQNTPRPSTPMQNGPPRQDAPANGRHGANGANGLSFSQAQPAAMQAQPQTHNGRSTPLQNGQPRQGTPANGRHGANGVNGLSFSQVQPAATQAQPQIHHGRRVISPYTEFAAATDRYHTEHPQNLNLPHGHGNQPTSQQQSSVSPYAAAGQRADEIIAELVRKRKAQAVDNPLVSLHANKRVKGPEGTSPPGNGMVLSPYPQNPPKPKKTVEELTYERDHAAWKAQQEETARKKREEEKRKMKLEAELVAEMKEPGNDILAYRYREYIEIFPLARGEQLSTYHTNLLANQRIAEDDKSEEAMAVRYAKEKWYNYWTVKDRKMVIELLQEKQKMDAGKTAADRIRDELKTGGHLVTKADLEAIRTFSASQL